LLIEESRTNLLQRSEEFNDTYWTTARLVSQPTPNTGISPSGHLTAEKLVPALSVGDHRIDRASIAALVVGTVYTVSVFVKASGYTGFGINVGSAPTGGVTYNLQTGQVESAASGWTASIQPYLDGWYRCVATFTFSAGTRLYFSVGQTGTIFSYAGNETDGVLIWGAQVEAGSFPTSYIPTVASSVVRSADVCSITGAPFSNMWNQTEGSLYTESFTPVLSGVSAMANSGSNANQVSVFRVPAGSRFGVAVSGTYSASLDVAISVTLSIKTIGGYSSISARQATNGTLSTLDTSVIVPTNLTRLNIGSAGLASSEYANGTISAIRYYRKRLSDSKLQALTA
jgi:hypothetical protein